MLSRTADHLYWMARYMERAENTARMLDVAHQTALLPGPHPEHQEWYAPLNITGALSAYSSRYGEVRPDRVIRFMALDPENPSSIFACIYSARENARAVRGSISSEMWESLNATWLELRNATFEQIHADGLSPFFDWVKERSHLFRGVTFGTMLHDEGFRFIRLGTFLERADNTARFLDVKYHILLPSLKDVGGAVDYYQWSALLRSLSALEAYQRTYRDAITPLRVAELLILRDDMPRSLHACLNEVFDILQKINGPSGAEVRRRAGELHASLHFGRISDIFQQGLHEYLTEFLRRIGALGEEIRRSFLLRPQQPEARPAVALAQHQ
ncbi:MAG: alpha-E domain-containing protein [Betaproteobacteria bacterium]|nr:alpha-E domain-containing protein [Betaproteobacteria bacterium]